MTTTTTSDSRYDAVFAALDDCRHDGAGQAGLATRDRIDALAAAVDAVVPARGTSHLSTAALLGGSLSAAAHLRALAAVTIAEQAWARGRDGLADIGDLTVGTGALHTPDTTTEESRGMRRQVLRTVPPLTGRARTRAAAALARMGEGSRPRVLTAIDTRDGTGLSDDAMRVLHAYATLSPDVAAAALVLARTCLGAHPTLSSASRVRRDDDRGTADHLTVSVADEHGRVAVLATAADWSAATVMRFDVDDHQLVTLHDVPTGLHPAEKDPWTVARKLDTVARSQPAA